MSGTAGSSDVLADVKNTLAENQVAEAVHKRRPSAGCILSGGQKKDPPTDPVQERSTLARPVHKGSAIMDKRYADVDGASWWS